MSVKKITWKTAVVKVNDLKENPNNPKKPDAKGRRQLLKSIGKFGVVIGGICNTDNMLIDGHSRKDVFEELGITEVEVRKPSRKLTASEYKELNAIYDIAKASTLNDKLLEELFTDDFFNEWEIDKKGSGILSKNMDGKYEIVPEADEKYNIVMIVCKTNTEASYVRNALQLDVAKSYKNKGTGQSFVQTAEKFIESWEKK